MNGILPHRPKSGSIALCIIFQSIKHLLHQRTLYQSQSIHLATIFSNAEPESEKNVNCNRSRQSQKERSTSHTYGEGERKKQMERNETLLGIISFIKRFSLRQSEVLLLPKMSFLCSINFVGFAFILLQYLYSAIIALCIIVNSFLCWSLLVR